MASRSVSAAPIGVPVSEDGEDSLQSQLEVLDGRIGRYQNLLEELENALEPVLVPFPGADGQAIGNPDTVVAGRTETVRNLNRWLGNLNDRLYGIINKLDV